MKIATIIARVLLGLVFVAFGSNAFLHFIPMPPMTEHPGEFIGSMHATGYLTVVAPPRRSPPSDRRIACARGLITGSVS